MSDHQDEKRADEQATEHQNPREEVSETDASNVPTSGPESTETSTPDPA